jgi:hypothetical protein
VGIHKDSVKRNGEVSCYVSLPIDPDQAEPKYRGCRLPASERTSCFFSFRLYRDRLTYYFTTPHDSMQTCRGDLTIQRAMHAQAARSGQGAGCPLDRHVPGGIALPCLLSLGLAAAVGPYANHWEVCHGSATGGPQRCSEGRRLTSTVKLIQARLPVNHPPHPAG